MQVYFSKDWLALVELSFRNFLAEAIEHLPLPTLLRFDTDRLQRSSLQKQVESLQTETADLKQQLSAFSKSNAAAADQQNTQRRQQHQQPRTHHAPVNSHFEDRVQHKFRPAQEGKAAAPPVAPKPDLQRHHNSSDASNTISSIETGHGGLANGEENTQSSTADKLAEGSLDNSHHLHPQAGSRITPRWSASLASLAISVLANSDTETPQQQASAADEAHSLDVDATSLHSLESEMQLSSKAGMSVATAEGQMQSARLGSGQGNSATGQQQTAPPSKPQLRDAEPDKDSQSQQGSEDAILHRRSDNAETVSSSQSDPAVEQLAGHDSSVTCCTFSPNGQNLATASTDGVVRISAPVSLQVQPSFAAALDLTCLSVSCASLCIMYHGRPSRST